MKDNVSTAHCRAQLIVTVNTLSESLAWPGLY